MLCPAVAGLERRYIIHDASAKLRAMADVLEADRFATAAFAMGRDGIGFLEDRAGLEGYAIAGDGTAAQTSGFGAYCP